MEIRKFQNTYLFNSKGGNFENQRFGSFKMRFLIFLVGNKKITSNHCQYSCKDPLRAKKLFKRNAEDGPYLCCLSCVCETFGFVLCLNFNRIKRYRTMKNGRLSI